MTSNKTGRQARIKELISTTEVSSQEDLCQILKESGFDTTQATLSRDLHEMGIVRIPSENGFKYVFHQDDNEQSLKKLIGMEIINVLHNESIVIVKTMPGRAAGVALYFDRLKNSQIIGTVAGDDSIMVIPESHDIVESVFHIIKEVMISG
jgi:transcriptional regulator of arginine metabolism